MFLYSLIPLYTAYMRPNFFLTSARLGFRTWEKEDFNLAKSLWGDPLVMENIDVRKELNDEEIQSKLEHEIEKDRRFGVQYWPMFNLRSTDFIGCCGLRPYNLNEMTYEIGFHICSEFWGHGYAKESARAVIKYGFDRLNIQRIFAGHKPNNRQSERIMDQLGFEYSHDEFFKPTGLLHPSYFLERN